ncbi:glycosyltransferase [uncultured Kriegella sp.]|uniref:glycosyltransferase n=1 Tax=uncultured Kriegella sp. TaxID=1798910 RepID=UPI0030DA5227|tara:strand:- start:13963 stop:14910 length:948 start_codon:yes stop_codon:yes gene_type:complete
MLAPICLFTYNRLAETKQTVEALQKNFLATQSHLIIFSDGAKNERSNSKITAVRQYLKTIDGFKSIKIYESQKNKGLAGSIIEGVTKTIEEYGKVIVLEDDLITSQNFLNFMNKALDHYATKEIIKSINGFSPEIKKLKTGTPDVYFQTRTFPWGWATWKNRWSSEIFSKEKIKKEINDDKNILRVFKKDCGNDIAKMLLDSISGKNDSWYVRWVFEHYRTQALALYPKYTLVGNSGFNENGTHCKTINPYKSIIDSDFREKTCFDFDTQIEIDPIIKRQFLRYFSIKYRIILRVKLLFDEGGVGVLWNDIKSRL